MKQFWFSFPASSLLPCSLTRNVSFFLLFVGGLHVQAGLPGDGILSDLWWMVSGWV